MRIDLKKGAGAFLRKALSATLAFTLILTSLNMQAFAHVGEDGGELPALEQAQVEQSFAEQTQTDQGQEQAVLEEAQEPVLPPLIAPLAAPLAAPENEVVSASPMSDIIWLASDFAISGERIIGLTASGRSKLMQQPEESRAITIPTIPGVNTIDSGFSGFLISKLTIESGYTTISANAFQNGNLTEVSFPNSLTTIGLRAFSGNRLATVALSHTALHSLGDEAFSNNQITSLTLPASLTAIPAVGFANNALSEVSLEHIKSIGSQAFFGNQLSAVSLPVLDEIAPDAFNSNGRVVALWAPASIESHFIAGSGHVVNPVTMIVKRVDAEGNPVASDIEVGNDFTSANLYPEGKMVDVIAPSLPGFVVSDAEGDSKQVLAQKDTVISFTYSSAAETVMIQVPAKIFTVDQIVGQEELLLGVTAVSGYDGSAARSLSVSPNSVDTSVIGSAKVVYKATDIYGNIGTKSVEIRVIEAPENELIDGYWQYKDFSYDGSTVTGFSDEGEAKCADVSGEGKQLALPGINPYTSEAITSIGAQAFSGKGLVSIDYRDSAGLVTIGEAAFASNSLVAVELIDLLALTTLGSQAFANNANLDHITLSNLPKLTSIEASAFASCNAGNITFSGLPELTTIGNSAFSASSRITSLDLSGLAKLNTIGASAFSTCTALQELNVSGLTLLETIGDSAFAMCKSLKSLDLSDLTNLQSIGNSSFNGGSDLQTLDLSGLENLRTIGNAAFSGAMSLTSLDFSSLKKLERMGTAAFGLCVSLTELNFVDLPKLTTIGPAAFLNCRSLESLTFEELPEFTTIMRQAFMGCGNVKHVTFSNLPKFTGFSSGIFQGFDAFESITMSDLPSVTKLDRSFSSTKLRSLTISDLPALTNIDTAAFVGSPDGYEANLDFSASTELTTIGDIAFRYARIDHLDLSNNTKLATIGNSAFYSAQLTELDLSNNTKLATIGDGAFYSAQLTELDLSNCTSFVSLGNKSFYSSSLDSITIGAIAESNQNKTLYGSGDVPYTNVICAEKETLPIYIPGAVQKLGNSWGYAINPVKTTVHILDDDTGLPLREDETIMLIAPLKNYEFAAPALFQYAPTEATKTLNFPYKPYEQTLELSFRYKKDTSISSRYTLTQEDKTDYSQVGVDGYGRIGSDIFSTLTTATAHDSESLAGHELSLYFDADRILPRSYDFSNYGTVDTSERGVLKFTFDSGQAIDTFGLSVTWSLIQGPTEDKLGQPITAELRKFDGAHISLVAQTDESQTILLKGYYRHSVLEPLSSKTYSAEVDNDGHFIPYESSIYIYQSLILDKVFERNVDTATYTVELPTYTALLPDGSTEQRKASIKEDVFFPWIDNGDGTASYTASNLSTWNQFSVRLSLDFADAQPGTTAELNASFFATPQNMAETETPFTDSKSTTYYFEEKQTDKPYFMVGSGTFYDNALSKSKEFSWTSGLYFPNMKKNIVELSQPVFKYYDLDERMYYTRVKPNTLGASTVRAYQSSAGGDTLIFEQTGVTGEVVFPEDINRDISCVTVEAEETITIAGATIPEVGLSVYAKLRDPENTSFNETESSKNTFSCSSRLIGGTALLDTGETQGYDSQAITLGKTMTVLKPTISIGKTMRGVGSSGEAIPQGTAINYDLSFNASSGSGDVVAIVRDVVIYDELPSYLMNTSFQPSRNLIEATTGLHYEIKGEAGVRDGVPYDLLIIKADTLDLSKANGAIGSINSQVDLLAPAQKNLQNTVYATFTSDPGDRVVLSRTTTDNPLKPGEEVLYAGPTAYAVTQANQAFVGAIYARKHVPGSATEWTAWSNSGIKTGLEEEFQYKLVTQNNSGQAVDNVVMYSILPFEGDAQGSKFRSTPRSLSIPENSEASFTTDPITASTELSGATWLAYDENQSQFENATAIRITLKSGESISPGAGLSAVITMTSPDTSEGVENGDSALNRLYYSTQGQGGSLVETAAVGNEIANPAQIEVMLEGDSNDAIQGAEFQLFDGFGTLVGRGISNENGKIVFSGLTQGSYSLKQISTMDGYELPVDAITIKAEDFSFDTGEGLFIASKSVVNNALPEYGELRIQVVDGSPLAAPLANASFSVEPKDGSSEAIVKTTDNSGFLLFSHLETGSYLVSQEHAPGSLTPVESFEVDITKDEIEITTPREGVSKSGTTRITVLNNKAKVMIGKLGMRFDANREKPATELVMADGLPQANASLELWEQQQDGGSSQVATLTTDPQGLAEYTDVKFETLYTIREAATGEAYEAAEDQQFYLSYDGIIKAADDTSFASDVAIMKSLPKREISIYKLGLPTSDLFEIPETELTLNQGAKLEGAQFEVYARPSGDTSTTLDKTRWEKLEHPDGAFTTNNYGYVSGFYSIDTLYCVIEKEDTAPAGYLYSDKQVYFRAIVNPDNTSSIVNEQGTPYFSKNVIFKNYPVPVAKDLSIDVVDNTSLSGLEGAVFKLEKKTDDVRDAEGNIVSESYETISESIRTDASGHAHFAGLDRGEYRLSQMKASKGYLRTARIEVFVVESNTASIDFTGANAFTAVKLEPTIVKGDYVDVYASDDPEDAAHMQTAIDYLNLKNLHPQVMKLSANQNMLLSGLKDSLFSFEVRSAEGTTLHSQQIRSDENGHFPELSGFEWEEDKTYVFTEIQAPAGYELDTKAYVYQPASERNLIEQTGGKWIALENQVLSHKIILSQVSSATGESLAGIGFTLYHPDATPVFVDETGVAQELFSDAHGFIAFDALEPGIYYLKETSTLPSYNLLQGYYRVIITGERDVSLTDPIEYIDTIAPGGSMEGILAEVTGSGSIAIKVFNDLEETPSLLLENKVAGEALPTSAQDFSYTLKVEDDSGELVTYQGPYKVFSSDADTVGQAKITANGNIVLADTQSIEVKSLTEGKKFEVTEDTSGAHFDYTVMHSINGLPEEEGSIASGLTNDTQTKVTFTNAYVAQPTVTLTSSPSADAALAVGEVITYTVTVANPNESTLRDIWVKDYIPAGTAFVDFKTPADTEIHHGIYSPEVTGPFVEWLIETIAPGQSIDLSFDVVVTEEAKQDALLGAIENEVLFQLKDEAGQGRRNIAPGDPKKVSNPIKNQAFLDSMLAVTVESRKGGEQLAVGDEIEYSLSVLNNSDKVLSGVWLRNAIPENTSFLQFISGATHAFYVEEAGRSYADWYVDRVEPGAALELSFKAKVAQGAEGATISNLARYEYLGATAVHDVKSLVDPRLQSNTISDQVKRADAAKEAGSGSTPGSGSASGVAKTGDGLAQVFALVAGIALLGLLVLYRSARKMRRKQLDR